MFIGSILFFALFTGGVNFQQDFLSEQGVDDSTNVAIEKEYDKLNEAVDSLRQKVRNVQRPETGLLDSAVAGLFLVPDFLQLLMSPIAILSTTIDSVAASYVFIPQFVATLLKTLIVLVVSYSTFRLLVGLRG